MEFIKPNAIYFDEYLAACKESHDNNITEWMPVELDDFDGWKERALRLYDIMTKPHSTVLDKNWLAWKEKSERNG